MRRSMRGVCTTLVAAALFPFALAIYGAGSTLTAEEAASHVGEHGTVCGKVASTRFAFRSRGQPTFLNLDRPYPNQIFTIVIWGKDRSGFNDSPETYYRYKAVCVTGTIKSYRGKPEIVIRNADQIRLQ